MANKWCLDTVVINITIAITIMIMAAKKEIGVAVAKM